MAHHIRIKKVPYTNKDGSISKKRFGYRVTDRHRGKKTVIASVTSRKAAEDARDGAWRRINTERGLMPELIR